MELEQVRTRVTPTSLAHERTLPISDELADLLPDDGLVRGRVLACTGPAATSLALALVAPAVAAGSWMALIDAPTIGLDAASELGVPLERLVRVASSDWTGTLVAALDGFDVVVTSVPRGALRRSAVTMLSSRIRQRGAVVVVMGSPGELACDGVLETSEAVWDGLGSGHGRLRRRRVEVRASGRRIPNARCRAVMLPGSDGRPESLPASTPQVLPVTDIADPGLVRAG
jgi:hypothetical protein